MADTCFPLRAALFAEKLRNAVLHGLRPARFAVEPEANQRAWLDWHDHEATQSAGWSASLSLSLHRDEPLVSICLSHFNRPEYLRQALASIEAQDYPNLEVVLVDDASTTPEAIACIESLASKFAAEVMLYGPTAR